jgi:hypothetical protein
VAAAGALAVTGLAVLSAVQASPAGALPPITETWFTHLPDTGGPVALSSPMVANLAGGPAVVVGDRTGYVWAFNLMTGNPVLGWPYQTGTPVDSTASTAPAGGGLDSVFIGSGNASSSRVGSPTATMGGYWGFGPSGGMGPIWHTMVMNTSTDLTPFGGVAAGLAVGNLQGQTDVTAGSLGQMAYALNAANGDPLWGWPVFQGDSDWSTPALADLYHNGQTEVVTGGDSTAGVAYGRTYPQGGLLKIERPTGNWNTGTLNGGEICEFDTTQSIESSPAVGEFIDSTQRVGIAFGTSSFFYPPNFPVASDSYKVFAVDSSCHLIWSSVLNGITLGSPALADALGNGQLQVIEGTNVANQFTSGSVYVLDGATGHVDWSAPTIGAVIGGITTADLTGLGYQDLLVPTTEGVQIFDGRSGQSVAILGHFEGFQNSPLVTNDVNGTIGITIAGYTNQNQGTVEHYELAQPPGLRHQVNVNETGAWPMFHHDPQLTGDAGTPVTVQVPCSKPHGTPYGYYLAGSDGGVFNFGNLPFCGSTGALTLNQPVVTLAPTPDAGGYWELARDGGIFNFGDARLYGSVPGDNISVTNLVALVPTRDGAGYLVVGDDGAVYAFGDSVFEGSLPGDHVTVSDVVGVVPTADGKGYWMVGRDGGVFAFGDAGYVGSLPGVHVRVSDIVGIVPTPDNRGYWMVGADGGVFAFGDAGFVGSLPGIHVTVNNIVGITPSPDGRGYIMAGTDGGVFPFGDAPYEGSLPALGVSTNSIVSIAGAPAG